MESRDRPARLRYKDAPATLAKLGKLGVAALHGVDATRLTGIGAHDEAVLTHPHLGVEDCVAHHRLLAHYFSAARGVAPVARVTLAGDQAARRATRAVTKLHGAFKMRFLFVRRVERACS